MIFTFASLRRHIDRPSARRQRAGRKPRVENLESRRLLSGIQGNHIGMAVAAVGQGSASGSGADTVRYYGVG